MTTALPIPASGERAEALLRALVGVADACVVAPSNGEAIFEVRVVPAPGQSQAQVTRNVTSALFAGLGVRLLPWHIQFADDSGLADIRARRVAEAVHVAAAVEAVAVPDAPSGDGGSSHAAGHVEHAGSVSLLTGAGNGDGTLHAENGNGLSRAWKGSGALHAENGNGTLHAEKGDSLSRAWKGNGASQPENGNGGAHAENGNGVRWARAGVTAGTIGAPPRTAAPAVVSVALSEHGERIRCHVTVAMFGQILAGAGEAPAVPGQAIDLAGRVTLDAVRGATHAAATLQFTGATRVELAGRPHILVALQKWRDGKLVPLAGAAPVRDSEEHAAADAVLGALRELF
jgi:hypothetical protein